MSILDDHLQRMASTGQVGSISDWSDFYNIVRGMESEIATLQSDLAAARAELARAKPALIKAWEIFFTRSFSQDPIGRAEARYAREIAHKGEEE